MLWNTCGFVTELGGSLGNQLLSQDD